jgi:hypothetical protein
MALYIVWTSMKVHIDIDDKEEVVALIRKSNRLENYCIFVLISNRLQLLKKMTYG